MRCQPCERNEHFACEPVADPEREGCWVPCACFHDPVVVTRDARITALLVAAQTAFARGDDEATVIALERALIVLQPWRTRAAEKPLRKLALVVSKVAVSPATTYAQASGEILPDWMTRTHGDKR